MPSITNANPSYESINPLQGYDDTNHQVVFLRVKNITTDSSVTPNVVVGDLGVQVEVSIDTTTQLNTAISDGVITTQKATVAQFHNADNQVLASTAYGLLTGGVAQLLNASGNLDRQRETGFDAIPASGVATGAQQFAGPALTTTFNGSVTGNVAAQSVVVVSSANAKIGDIVVTQDNQEYVQITAIVDGTHVTGIFKNNHASGQSLTWYHYNQARDATIGDQVPGTGLSPSATYLYNNIAANFEFDRSANGEKDGASGQGTAVAAEYEWNANPLANGNVLSGLQFDRARNLQAKGLGSGTISNNPLAANSTTLTLNSAPTTLQPGMQIVLDRAGANPEGNYVGTGYTAGSTSVPLQIATQFSHAQNATVEWDQFAPLGAGLNGFLATGLGIEEEAIFNPVDNKMYIQRAATADGMAAANLPAEGIGLWNGATMDRQRGNLDNITILNVSAVTTTQTSADQTNYNAHGLYIVVNVTTLTGTSPTLTPLLQGKGPVSVQYFGIGAALTAINATGKFVYFYSLNAPAAAGGITATIAFPIPRTWNFVMTAGGTITNATYTVEASYIL